MVRVLTPGNYGPATISQAISIVADGVEGVSVAASGGGALPSAFLIQAAATDVVTIRGVAVDPMDDISHYGITFTSGAALHVQNCLIRRGKVAIYFAPSGASKLSVSNCTIADSISAGIVIAPQAGGSAKASIDRTRMVNRSQGMSINGPATVTVHDSLSSGNNFEGISARGNVNVMIDRTSFVNNATGVAADQSAIIRIGDSVVSGNGTGLKTTLGGKIYSYQTNKLDGNGTAGAFTGSLAYK